MSDSTSNIKEYELMDRLRRGDVQAFDTIFHLYAKRVFAYLAKSSLSKEDAEEITHDVFMSLWKIHTTVDPSQSLSWLLFAIAYRKRVDAFRRSLNSPVYENFINLQNELVAEQDCKLESRDFYRVLKSALDSFPERQRTIIILSQFKGFTPAEIAAKLDISEKTVRNYLATAIANLKETITRNLKK